jgi:hypothetical protein
MLRDHNPCYVIRSHAVSSRRTRIILTGAVLQAKGGISRGPATRKAAQKIDELLS